MDFRPSEFGYVLRCVLSVTGPSEPTALTSSTCGIAAHFGGLRVTAWGFAATRGSPHRRESPTNWRVNCARRIKTRFCRTRIKFHAWSDTGLVCGILLARVNDVAPWIKTFKRWRPTIFKIWWRPIRTCVALSLRMVRQRPICFELAFETGVIVGNCE